MENKGEDLKSEQCSSLCKNVKDPTTAKLEYLAVHICNLFLFSASERGMMCTSISAAAPEFFLHHGFIDKLWGDWQKKSSAHKRAYFANSHRRMTGATASPSQMLDLSNLGAGIRVVYDDPTHNGVSRIVEDMRREYSTHVTYIISSIKSHYQKDWKKALL